VDQSIRQIFLPNVGVVADDEELFPIFDVLILSGDIRDQSRKLSKIAKNFGRFLAVTNFWGGHCKNCAQFITPASRHVG